VSDSSNIRLICKIDDCETISRRSGCCIKHYNKLIGPGCRMDGCSKPESSKLLCSRHYLEFGKDFPNRNKGLKHNRAKIFCENAVLAPRVACIEWPFSLRSGYGRLKVDGRMWTAHRYTYMLKHGEIDDGLTIDHICRNKACVNPAHLEQVSVKENNYRRDYYKLGHDWASSRW